MGLRQLRPQKHGAFTDEDWSGVGPLRECTDPDWPHLQNPACLLARCFCAADHRQMAIAMAGFAGAFAMALGTHLSRLAVALPASGFRGGSDAGRGGRRCLWLG